MPERRRIARDLHWLIGHAEFLAIDREAMRNRKGRRILWQTDQEWLVDAEHPRDPFDEEHVAARQRQQPGVGHPLRSPRQIGGLVRVETGGIAGAVAARLPQKRLQPRRDNGRRDQKDDVKAEELRALEVERVHHHRVSMRSATSAARATCSMAWA